MEIIEGIIRDYAWGSTTALPDLLGRPVTGEPMAELWLGAHSSGPALVGCAATPLDRVVADDPTAALGADTAKRFGQLPFLLKVLAADAPLSLQAHPSTAQAEAGFAREDAARIPLDAPSRSFKDRSHKPELICALSEFVALCGFRDPAITLELLESVGIPALETVQDMIRAEGLGPVLAWLLRHDDADAAALVEPVVAACREDRGQPFAAERAMAADLGDRYPGDVGVVIALLLNLVVLQPGEALFLGPGNLHAYVRGTGVEIMANSDNVLRGGLTPKHVDVDTLLEVVDATSIPPIVQRPPVVEGIATYECPVPEFGLQRIELDGEVALGSGPAILLCTSGAARCGDHTLERGGAAWIPATDGPVVLAGRATVFRGSVH